ncbi:MAG: DUF262 domain-containing protein [Lachnospiraceae bacterium]|nr:DUF262 domain-containing protein [Lachnospiraceae bacterium]
MGLDQDGIVIENTEELEQLEYVDDKNMPIFKTVNVAKKDFSLYELFRKYNKGKVIYEVDFQRSELWEPKQKYELIESILMGLPLPIFYFKQSEDEYIVVDGKQRLSTLFSFFRNEFALKNLRVLDELNGKRFDDLTGKYSIYQSQLEDYQIYSHLILPPTPDKILFDIFDRVNRGGTKLNKQEIRNALYHGKGIDMINSIVKTKEFINATNLKPEKDRRMKASYLITRFLAFYMYFNNQLDVGGKAYEYKDIDELLEFTLKCLNKKSDKELKEYSDLSVKCLQMSYDLIGKGVFRKSLLQSNPINMNIFETTMYLMSEISLCDLKKSGINFRKRVLSVIESEKFLSCIGDSRDGNSKMYMRFELMGEIADGIMEEIIG